MTKPEPGTCPGAQCQSGLDGEQSSSPRPLSRTFVLISPRSPVQHKRLNSKCQKQREEELEIKVLLSCFFESGFGCDWIEGLRLREREWR